jgi:hypothetical protein
MLKMCGLKPAEFLKYNFGPTKFPSVHGILGNKIFKHI